MVTNRPKFAIATVALILPVLVQFSSLQPAQAQPPNLTPSQTQQLSNALFRSSSQEFFERGNQQLEQDLQRVQGTLFSPEQHLKITQELEVNDLPSLENSNPLPPSPQEPQAAHP